MIPSRRLACLSLSLLCALPVAARAAPVYSLTLLPPGLSGHGLNNAGQVVGEAPDAAGNGRAAFWNGGPALADLGTLGGTWSTALALNDRGAATGFASVDPATTHAFIYANGSMTDIGTLGGAISYGIAINDAGQVAGQSANAAGGFSAFLYSGGAMRDLGTLGGDFAYAAGINAAGAVVGNSSLSLEPGEQATHAYLYAGGVMTDLGTLGGSMSSASDVNDIGQVVGNSELGGAGGEHAYLWEGGVMRDIGSFGGRFTNANAINNAGLVVGHSEYLEGEAFSHAFLYDGGQMLDLNGLLDQPSPWTLVAGHGINDANQILAFACMDFDNCRSVLLDPVSAVPEPSTATLLLAGLALVGWRGVRPKPVAASRRA